MDSRCPSGGGGEPVGGRFWLDWEPPTRTDRTRAWAFACPAIFVRSAICACAVSQRTPGTASKVVESAASFHPLGCRLKSPWRWARYLRAERWRFATGDSGLPARVGYGCCIHVFGSKRGARNILISRCAAIGSHALSQREAVKPPIVVDEEDAGQFCDGIEISECVVGNPYRYPEGGGFGHLSLQLGGPRGTLNGSIVIRDSDFIGPPGLAEPWAWVRASGLWIAHRPGQTGVDQGWGGRHLALHGELQSATIVQTPGYPERALATAVGPRVRVWANPTEAGRTHVVVTALQGETSATVDASFERGRKYRVTEIMRDVSYEFKASGSSASIPLPNVEPSGCVPGRSPHPISFQFLIRRV